MKTVEFRLSLGSASISEEMQFSRGETDAEIQVSLEDWKEDQIEYSFEIVEEDDGVTEA